MRVWSVRPTTDTRPTKVKVLLVAVGFDVCWRDSPDLGNGRGPGNRVTYTELLHAVSVAAGIVPVPVFR